MMHALRSHAVGGPETLTLDELPLPEPGRGEVRIKVQAAGVNFPDTLIIRDLYQFKPERPFAPGGEVAGTIDAIGDGVENFVAGDRVLALTGHGGFATHIVTATPGITKVPDGMPFEDAAAFMMTYATSYYALKNRAQIKPGESLFILGAAGGVGSASIELGKAMGANVIAGVSSEGKAEFSRDLGADETLIYPKGTIDRSAQKEFSNNLKAISSGGIDVIYDAVGGDYAEPAVRAMSWEGRYLVIGFPAGIPAIPLNLTLLKNCQIMGVFWGAFTMRDPAGHQENMNDLFKMYADGKIKPRVTKTFALKHAADALTMLDDRVATGKLVVNMSN